MKTINLFLITFFLIASSAFCQEDKKEARAKKQLEMIQLIESGHFNFVARSAESAIGNFPNLSPNYTLSFDGLHVKAFLPYFGRAYQVDYGDTEGGVKFDLEATKIEKSYNEKKKLYTISTELKEKNEIYTIHLIADVGGFATLKVNFLNRQWINYSGTIERIEKQ
jgi:hypothetical protein